MVSASLPANLPSLVVPDGLGVNIHFTGAPARDLDLLQAAGFRFIRMDFHWVAVEKEKGLYHFEPYDQLTEALAKRGIRALYILDYSNSLYETDQSVRTEEGRQAFARFAAAAAKRYRGRGILWELWNEPNISFWKPQPSVGDYMALAHAVFPAIREADPQALRVAPATSGVPLDFLEACFREGLLQLVDAVTVHPYRQQPPETVVGDILRLRALIAHHCPDRPDLPILSGEWGYSAVWGGFDEQRQGQYLPRQFLTNLSLGIPVSIWYDWHDDGPDPKEPEHHFGTVTLDYKPKPAYLAMQRLVQALEGMRFVKRLRSAPEDFVLLFSDDKQRAVAAWTTGEPHEAEPIPGQKVRLSADPQYLPVSLEPGPLLAEGAWTVAVRSVGLRGGAAEGQPLAPAFEVRVQNPFSQKVAVRLKVTTPQGMKGRFLGPASFNLASGQQSNLRWRGEVRRSSSTEIAVTVEAEVGGFRSEQQVPFVLTNPIFLDVRPEARGRLAAVFRDPSGDGFKGKLVTRVCDTTDYDMIDFSGGIEAHPKGHGEAPPTTATVREVSIELPLILRGPERTVRVTLRDGDTIVADSGALRFVPLQVSTQTARAVNDGDAKVPAKFELTDMAYKQPDAPVERGVCLTYDYGEGWKFVRIAPPKELAIEGTPHALSVWVKGDGSGCALCLRFMDENGRTFQPDFGPLDFKEWRYLTAPIDNPNVGHWGGDGDPSRIAYPIRLNTFILVDSKRAPVKGEVEFADFRLIYRE